MRINIPFTNTAIELNALSLEPDKKAKRPVAYGYNYPFDPSTDLMGIKYNVDSFYKVYRKHSDMRAVIREMQQNVGSNGWKLQDRYDPSLEIDASIWDRVTEILTYQNRPLSYLINWILLDLKIGGNFYGYKVRNVFDEVIGIQRIDPRTISIVQDQFGGVYRFLQRNYVSTVQEFDPSEIIHIPNTVDADYPAFGMSEVEALYIEVASDTKAATRNKAFLENFTIPGAIYRLKDMTPKERKEAFDFIEENFKGAENAHKPAVLAGVEGVDTYSFNNKDMEFMEGRRFSTEKICSAFGTPKSILGYTEGMTYSNVEGMYKKWILNTIIPEEVNLAAYLGSSILEAVEAGASSAIEFAFNHQNVADDIQALNEFRSGALTLRQYKDKTGQDVDQTDEDNPVVDTHIIQNGTAILLEQAGEMGGENPDMVVESTNRLIQEIQKIND